MATAFDDGQPEINLANSPNVDESGYLRTSAGELRVRDDGRLFGFENGSPDFPSQFDTILDQYELVDQLTFPNRDFDTFRNDHFQAANNALADVLEANPGLADHPGVAESIDQLRALRASPANFTWHHHQDFGRMQLVPRSVHTGLNHTGGIALWGRLAEYLELV